MRHHKFHNVQKRMQWKRMKFKRQFFPLIWNHAVIDFNLVRSVLGVIWFLVNTFTQQVHVVCNNDETNKL